jgi:dipeptidyl aminopeptidase/acylaminoacyl peptidase
MFDIDRYLAVESAAGASFGPDGEQLSFLMNTTGTHQVWTLDGPEAWPDRRTFYDEQVSFASFSPERRELVFGMDEGGNERTQFYRLDPDSGEITDLTRHPEKKHQWGGWSHDGEQFAFTSNRRDERVFDVYVQDRDAVGEAATLVAESDGWYSAVGWSPSDDRILLHEMHSNYDHDVHVLDLDSGERRHLTPETEETRYASLSWAPDGESVYVTTDAAADTLELARLDLADLSLETVVSGGDWNVDGVSIDHDTGRVVYARNVDGYTELTTGELDEAGGIDEFGAVDLPQSVSGGVSFDPDAERFAVTATSSTLNTNVFVVDVQSGETTRWTRASTAGIPPETFVEPELVHYPTFDGREIPAFFSLPETDTGSGETPVIVDIHGGPESQRRPSFTGVKQYFLSRGYAYFEPNVRGSTGYGKEYTRLDDVRNRMDSVADVKAGVEWLHDHPAVDPDRIVAYGGSYGGFMVLASLTEYPELWAAGVDVVGIANFVTFLENTGEWRREHREAEYGSLDEDREFLESISPTNNIEKIQAPLFVLHGENDPRVPVEEAHQIVEQARAQGVPVRELVFEDEGHGFSKLENRKEAYSAIAEFLDEHV